MTERPIRMIAPMVRALLAGTKTQTRSIVKPQPHGVALVASGNHLFDYRDDLGDYSRVVPMDKAVTLCPHGKPSDRLWVREAHAFSVVDPEGRDWHDDPENWDVIYRADENQPGGGWRDGEGKPMAAPWRPSIHMPRWASRITLEVTDVRVQRLQDISGVDAAAEGVEPTVVGAGWRRYADPDCEAVGLTPCRTPVESYRSLWEHLNGPGSWDANPWVWVIGFRPLAAQRSGHDSQRHSVPQEAKAL